MESKDQMLSLTQFAKMREVSRDTVIKWIRLGRLEGVVKDDTVSKYLIPESNLSVPFMRPGRPRRLNRLISSAEEAKEIYNSVTHRKIPFSYDELKKFFDDGMTLTSVAKMSGVSRQRIEQIYNRFFAPISISMRDRRKETT